MIRVLLDTSVVIAAARSNRGASSLLLEGLKNGRFVTVVSSKLVLRPFLRDADDNFVLELAFAGGIDYLVTHNVRDFTEAESFGVTVIRPGEFAELLRGMP